MAPWRAQDAGDATCSDGSAPAEVRDGQVRIKPRLNEDQLAKALEKTKDFKVRPRVRRGWLWLGGCVVLTGCLPAELPARVQRWQTPAPPLPTPPPLACCAAG